MKIPKIIVIIFAVVGFVILVRIALSAVIYVHAAYVDSQVHYAQPVGRLVLGNNAELNKVVTAWETQHAEDSFSYDTPAPVKAKCTITMYGYDARYVYANSVCESVGGDPTGWSVPTRFSYDAKTMQVTGDTEQGDDNRNPSIADIFPREVAKLLDS